MTDLELNCLPEEEGGQGGLSGAAMRGGWEGGAPHGGTAAAKGGAGAGAEAEAAGPLVVNEVADKLDSMMELTFAHLERRLTAGQHAAAWATLLAAFERSVLHTHRSKFVQFVLFYGAKAAPETAPAALLDLLISRLTDRHQPPITRAACAAYAASFLARWARLG